MAGSLRRVTLFAGATVASVVALALFERLVPRRVLRWYQKHVGGPMFRTSAGLIPGWAVIETIGRRTGNPHRVPVGGRLVGASYWCIAGTGRENQWVRNIERNPNVRVRVHGRWREGTAHLCPDDDARRRLLRLNPVNALFLRLTGFELLTVRIDLNDRTLPAGFELHELLEGRLGTIRVGSRPQPACLWSQPSGYIGPRLLRKELACASGFAARHPEGWHFVVDTRRVRLINPVNPLLLRRLIRLPHLRGYISISPPWIRLLARIGQVLFRPTHLVGVDEEALAILRGPSADG